MRLELVLLYTRLYLIENSHEFEGTQKVIAKFPFADSTIKDLCLLDPGHRFETNAASVTQLTWTLYT